MTITEKVFDALENANIKTLIDPKYIILPKKYVKGFLEEIQEYMKIPEDKYIKDLEGCKFNGIRVISSEDIEEIEIV